ncbi:MAG: PPC domain-containing protein, partial [Flavobacteriales bacterium]
MTVAITATSQCGYDASYPNYGDVTPVAVGTPNELINFVWAGEHYTINATAGCTYTVSMCGTSWDTQLTIFDATNTEVASNDDSCGTQSEVTFTAASTQAYTVQVNEWPCLTNSTDAEYFGVSLISCPVAISCDDPAACNYDASTSGTADCCYDECITFIAGGGTFDGEISWSVTDGATTIASGVANNPSGIEVCIPDGCYTINYMDSFGDGWDGATFTVINDGQTVFTGTMGSGASLSQDFCTEYVPPCFDSEPTGCPDIDAGDDISIPSCTDPCTPMDIEAEVFESGFSDSYRVCEIDYAPPYAYNAGTPFSVAVDDVWTDVINLPFNFCFFGVNYNQAIVGSNGLISFDTTDAL